MPPPPLLPETFGPAGIRSHDSPNLQHRLHGVLESVSVFLSQYLSPSFCQNAAEGLENLNMHRERHFFDVPSKLTHNCPKPPVRALAPASGAAKQTGGAFRAFILLLFVVLILFFFAFDSGSAVIPPRVVRGRRPWPPPVMPIPLLRRRRRTHDLLSPASRTRDQSVRLGGQ